VDVLNGPGTTPVLDRGGRSGLGVAGMAERVGAVGGTFAASATIDGGWHVRAHIPLRRDDSRHSGDRTWAERIAR
jgi:glucose-6-phosphate-specific signal transduction histidine kinase